MAYKILGNISSIASVVALLFIDTEWYWWRILGIVLGVLGTVYLIIVEIVEYINSRPVTLKSNEEIRNYMYDWVNTSGRVYVFSRDLSWVDEKIKIMMQAKGNDLYVCAEKESQLIKDLRKSDVNVYLYGGIDYSPCSRFTIIRANKTDKQIAIARVQKQNRKEKHIIYESKSEYMDEWLLSISTDLVDLTKLVDKLISENKCLSKQKREGQKTNAS